MRTPPPKQSMPDRSDWAIGDKEWPPAGVQPSLLLMMTGIMPNKIDTTPRMDMATNFVAVKSLMATIFLLMMQLLLKDDDVSSGLEEAN